MATYIVVGVIVALIVLTHLALKYMPCSHQFVLPARRGNQYCLICANCQKPVHHTEM